MFYYPLKMPDGNGLGPHYDGFWTILEDSSPDFNAKSPMKFFKIMYLVSNCGTWVKN